MFWRLHTAVFGQRIVDAFNYLDDLGDQVQIVSGASLTVDPVPLIDAQPALAITTLQDARRQSGHFGGRCTPWLFYNENDYSVTRWMSRLEISIPVLNRGGIFVPYGLLSAVPASVLRSLAMDGKIFIKPDKGHKSFVGQSFTIQHFHEEIKQGLGNLNLDPDVMCFLAGYRELKEIEWRFWIINREVVAWSPYSWDGEICWSMAPNTILNLAKLVAGNDWQPDLAYVVDIIETADGSVFVNEINAASTSGVYWAPIDDLLFSLREVAHAEFAGDVSL